MKRKPIDVEELKKVFRINDKGKLEKLYCGRWKEVPVVSNHDHGYCRVGFNSMRVCYHTIVWILTTGEDIPEDMVIDHINGNKLDNRIENLRLVNQRVNTQNKKAHRQGKLVGCYFDKCRDRYKAQVQIGKKAIYLGRYATEEEAHNIYVNACEHIEEYVDDDSFRELVNKAQK